MSKPLEIRNSTAEFLIFQIEGKEDGVQVLYRDETIWCTQKAMSVLFDVDRTVITKHLKNIFNSNELQMNSVCANFAHTATDGKNYSTQFYSLDAVISVGYRVNSVRATQFRQNYLKESEMEDMGRLVNAVLDIAERMAERHIPMSMEDWSKRIDTILVAGGDAVLHNAGSVTAEEAKIFAETEFEKYRIIQDRLFKSDFDRFADENLLPIDV